MAADWDWNATKNKEFTVFPNVQALAVYPNEAGDLVIRQEGFLGEEDEIIIVPKMHIEALIEAIQQAANS